MHGLQSQNFIIELRAHFRAATLANIVVDEGNRSGPGRGDAGINAKDLGLKLCGGNVPFLQLLSQLGLNLGSFFLEAYSIGLQGIVVGFEIAFVFFKGGAGCICLGSELGHLGFNFGLFLFPPFVFFQCRLVFLVGLAALPFAPETRGRPLPE